MAQRDTYSVTAVPLLVVVVPGQTDEEIEKKITENPTGFAREALLAVGANEQVQQVYSEVQSRARDVEMLAASIREVHEMFKEAAMLLGHQHDEVDTIEKTVSNLPLRRRVVQTALSGGIAAFTMTSWLCDCCGLVG